MFDLPHVVSGLKGSENLKYVAGDMFEAIPPADAILLKVNHYSHSEYNFTFIPLTPSFYT